VRLHGSIVPVLNLAKFGNQFRCWYCHVNRRVGWQGRR
jgi:uncharacterized protein with PIN domain